MVRKFRIVQFLFCLFFLFLAFESLAEEKGSFAPKLVASNTTYRFDPVKEGERVEHDFILRNDGDTDLNIGDVRGDCGCTAAVVDQVTIAPKTEGKVRVSFDTTGFRGFKSKTVRVYTDDKSNPYVVLKVEGDISSTVQIIPEILSFGTVKRGAELTSKLVVESKGGVKLLGVDTASQRLTLAELAGSNENKRICEVKFVADMQAGPFRGDIILRTNDKSKPIEHIPVTAFVAAKITAQPSEVSFGLLRYPLSNQISKIVNVTLPDGVTAEQISVLSDNPFVSAKIVVTLNPGNIQMQIDLAKDAIGSIRSRLTIAVKERENEQMVIPVYAIITQRNE